MKLLSLEARSGENRDADSSVPARLLLGIVALIDYFISLSSLACLLTPRLSGLVDISTSNVHRDSSITAESPRP